MNRQAVKSLKALDRTHDAWTRSRAIRGNSGWYESAVAQVRRRYGESQRGRVRASYSSAAHNGAPISTDPETVRAALLNQKTELGFVCRISELPESVVGRLHLDHDHKTGAFRGWIAGRLNQAIGLLRDDPCRIRALGRYLARPSTSIPYSPGIRKTEAGRQLLSNVVECEVCWGVKRLSIDHDHETGFVRGVLCIHCNHAEGFVRAVSAIKPVPVPELLDRMANYLAP